MNCWKSINFKKEYGLRWLRIISCLIALLAFIILYVPISIVHGDYKVNEIGIWYLMAALILLPSFHSFTHILPLTLMKRRVNFTFKRNKFLPIFKRYPNIQLSKTHFLIIAFAPTVFITIPGMVASLLIPEFYVYFLAYTAIHIGVTFVDYLYIINIIKAPKESYVENLDDGFDILLKSS